MNSWTCRICTLLNSGLICDACESPMNFGLDSGVKSHVVPKPIYIDLTAERTEANGTTKDYAAGAETTNDYAGGAETTDNDTTKGEDKKTLTSRAEMEADRLARMAKKRVLTSEPVGKKVKLQSLQTDYFKGFIGMTRVPGSNGLTMSQIIEPGVQRALFSSYVLDVDWLLSHIPGDTPTCIVKTKPKDLPADTSMFQASSSLMYVFPTLLGYGCMHIKLMVLWYSDRLRFVLPSANLIPLDWQHMENVVFVQDFPLKISPGTCPFEDALSSLLSSMKVPRKVLDRISLYNFSSAVGTLVSSMPGSHSNGKWGHPSLARISSLLLPPSIPMTVSYQTSSLGNLTLKWIQEFYRSATGSNGSDFSILFPSRETVLASQLGPSNASTICFQSANWDKPGFARNAIKDCKSKVKGSLMHSKIMILHPTSLSKDVKFTCISVNAPSEELKACQGILYCGSHNSTAAAWGSLTKASSLRIYNWELGIVFPLLFQESRSEHAIRGLSSLPFEYPPLSYTFNQRPWSGQ